MTARYIAIHGHFYQPPRENPWLEAIERQESARPYHDWNARIAAECYAPNAAARILGPDGRIVRIVDNYRRISFNVGPTLLTWLAERDPETYTAILAADRASIERFGGHGSAIAQAYGHTILPLMNARDRVTQVRWGIRDFEHRFGRRPEGMWLPETAVDVESLETLAAEGIAFTILAPHQAEAVRPMGDEAWRDVTGARIDRGRPYVAKLPSGKTMTLFFYDGPLSRAVAFERVLADGEGFARHLTGAFVEGAVGPRLVHIATDGETYGHHHRHGEMALAWALKAIEGDDGVALTNYGEYLERHPPGDEVRILENTSWSCAHGVERWRSDCGCSSGRQPTWHQRWRAPLRTALDGLRDELAPLYESAAGELLRDPWGARDDYVDVVLDRSPANLDRFFGVQAARELDADERVRALELLELQRHAMLMYTSCGWFFDEISGIETVQVLQYAGRAVQLAQDLFGDRIEEQFLERLESAPSNLPDKKHGRRVYDLHVRPAVVDLRKVGAHYAVSSLFEEYDDEERITCYVVSRQDERRSESGRARLVVGWARIRSIITLRVEAIAYAAIHLGDQNVVGGVREYRSEEEYAALADEMQDFFARGDFPAVLRKLDEAFSASSYSLKSLFRDQQRRILRRILEESTRRAAGQFTQIYESRAPLMRFVADLGLPPPRPFRMAAEFVINTELRRAIAADDLAEAERWLEAGRLEGVDLEEVDLVFAAQRALGRAATRLLEEPEDVESLERLSELVRFLDRLPFDVPLDRVQNAYWKLLQQTCPAMRDRADSGNETAREWCERFEILGGELSVAVEAVTGETVES